MPTITIDNFSKGINPNQTIGTKGLFKASEGMLGFGQNVNAYDEVYGNNYLTPGWGNSSLDNVNQLTGLPVAGAYSIDSAIEYLDMISGINGNTNKISRYDITNGELKSNLGSSGTDYEITVVHSGHSNNILHDIIHYNDGTARIYFTGRDDTDNWLAYYDVGDTNPSINYTTFTDTNLSVSPYFSTQRFNLMVGDDDNLYMSKQLRSIVSKDDLDNVLINLKNRMEISGMYKYRNYMAIAYSEPVVGLGHSQIFRKGSSGIAIWNYQDTTIQEYVTLPDVPRIVAGINLPDGNLILFGGKNNGTGLYSFTGNGFRELIRYKAETPKSKHSVVLDRNGRVVWVTEDGYILRYDIKTGILENLSTVTSTDNNACIFINANPQLSQSFAVTHKVSTTNTVSTLSEDSYIGDGGNDTNKAPVAITPLITIPYKAKATTLRVFLKENLASGQKLRFRIMKNGSTSNVTTIGTMDYSSDGAISVKELPITDGILNNFAIEITWQHSDNSASVPALDKIEVDWTK